MKTVGVSFTVGASLGKTVASAFSTVSSRIKTLNKDVRDLKKEQEAASKLSEAHGKLEKLRAAYTAAPSKQLKTEVDIAARAFTKAEKGAANYNVSVADAAKVNARATAAIQTTTAALERQKTFQANAAKRQELHGQMLGTVATFATVAVPIKLAIDFESAFADVRKVVDFASEEEAKGAQQDILALSRKTGLAAEGIAQIYASAGEAGLAKTREALQRFADTAATMAVAYGISADEAGDKMASWRAKMNLTEEEVGDMADAMNHLGNNMAATAKDTATVVERMGAVAKGAGLSAKSIAALGATFVAASPNPEMAATGMKNFLLALTKGDQMTAAQKTMMSKLGINPKELANAMQKDAEGTIVAVMEALARLPQAEQGGALSALFGSESIGAIQPLLTNTKMLNDAFTMVADRQQYAGSMLKEYQTRSGTTQHSLNQLRRSAEAFGIVLGKTVLPGVAAVAQGLTAMLHPLIVAADTFPGVTKVAFGVVAGLVALKLAAFGGAYAATIISDGWTIAKGVFNAVRPSVLANTVALQKQRVVTLYSAAATRVKVVWEKAHALAVAMSNRQTALSTLGQIRHRVVALTVAASTKIMTVAQWALNTAMTANPIGVVVVALTALGGWFYTAYEKAGSFTGALRVMWDQFKAVVPTMEVVEAAVVGMVTFVSDVWNGASLYDAGAKLMGTLWDGVVAMWQTVKGYWQTVKGWLGFGEGEDLDIKAVAESKTVGEQTTVTRTETVGQTEAKAQPMSTASPEAQKASASAPQGRDAVSERPAPSSGGGRASVSASASAGGGIQIVQQFTFQLSGMPDKEFANRVVEVVKGKTNELEKVLRDVIANQRRLAYDS